jgi:hypothetical protein
MIRGCLKTIGCGSLLVAGLFVGWFARDDIARFAKGAAQKVVQREAAPVELAGSTVPDLARQVEDKIIALGQGEMDEAVLSAEELDSWIRYRLEGFFPDYISGISASIADEDRLQLAGRVATDDLPGLDGLGIAASIIPDTADVAASGRLDGLEPGRGVFYIESLRLGTLPLPDAWRDQLIEELRGAAEEGLPVNAVTFELPPFVTDISVRGDQIVLRSASPDDR